MNIDWIYNPVAALDSDAVSGAQKRQNQLTKPLGSLGRLEEVVIRLAGMHKTTTPSLDRIHITIFAADHGVAEENVSAYPQAVTVEMIKNFVRGGAAISVLTRQLDATLSVINLGTAYDMADDTKFAAHNLGPGTANFCKTSAMTVEQLQAALDIGRQAVTSAVDNGADLFIGGEMGIANTTSATALVCALLKVTPENITGPGTGLDQTGIARKVAAIKKGLALHAETLKQNNPKPAVNALQCLGGFEIAALTGAYLSCAQQGIPALIDGYITGVAALLAEIINPGSSDWFLYSHTSAEPGHTTVLKALNAKPLINMHMRLGEGSGAAVAVPMLRLACSLHNDMATFAEAGVSESSV